MIVSSLLSVSLWCVVDDVVDVVGGAVGVVYYGADAYDADTTAITIATTTSPNSQHITDGFGALKV